MLKRFVYVLKSAQVPPRYYTGLTSDVRKRIAEHNAGSCAHTAQFGPWSVDIAIEFADERRAVAFERYLNCQTQVRRREAADQANRSLAFREAQLAPDQSDRDQNRARQQRREICGPPGTWMRQGGSADPQPDGDKEKN